MNYWNFTEDLFNTVITIIILKQLAVCLLVNLYSQREQVLAIVTKAPQQTWIALWIA